MWPVHIAGKTQKPVYTQTSIDGKAGQCKIRGKYARPIPGVQHVYAWTTGRGMLGSQCFSIQLAAEGYTYIVAVFA